MAMTESGKRIKAYFSKGIIRRKRPDDKEFDSLVHLSTRDLFNQALRKTGLDSDDCIRGPVIIIGPRLQDRGGIEFAVKKGKDDLIRYIPLGVTIINFTVDELVVYQCVFDPTTENSLNESTFEYYYNDIVSLETRTESYTKREYNLVEKIINNISILKNIVSTGKVEQHNLAEKFLLTTSGGSRIEVVLAEDTLIEEAGGGEVSTSEAEKSIMVVRRMLRDKKC